MSDWLDGLLLACLQFALTIGFHILFPSLTIGLAATWPYSRRCG